MLSSRLVVAVALVAAAAPARAFHREEAKGVPGRCLWWAKPSVTYRLNASNANTFGCASRSDTEALATASFATWGAAAFSGVPACTGFGFVNGGPSPTIKAGYEQGGSNENLVVWRKGRCTDVAPAGDPCFATPGACADSFNCWEHGPTTIGLTTTTYVPATGEIVDADMELNEHDANENGYWFTCAGPGAQPCSTRTGITTSCVSMDLGSTVTHEAGHMLGLAHNCEGATLRDGSACPDIGATMFASAAIGDTNKRDLRPDDVAGVCQIYPAGAAPSPAGGTGESGATCEPLPAPSPKTGGGCATAGPVESGFLLALAALARALRRR